MTPRTQRDPCASVAAPVLPRARCERAYSVGFKHAATLAQMQSLLRVIGGKVFVAYKFEPDESNPKAVQARERKFGEQVRADAPSWKNFFALRKERCSSLVLSLVG